jgi:hypothetical protein
MFYLVAALSLSSLGLGFSQDLPNCEIYSENKCNGDVIVTDKSFEDHRWFTPKKGDADYLSSYQGYSNLAAHVHLTYDSSRS